LRPGTYTVIGSRRRFRDIGTRFSVGPSIEEIIVVVRCKERI